MKFTIIIILFIVIYFLIKEKTKEKKLVKSIDKNQLKEKITDTSKEILLKDIYNYFYFFSFSKGLNEAIVKAFKDVDLLKTIYFHHSFPIVTSGFFSTYLIEKKGVKSTMTIKDNGITQIRYNGGLINLEEKLYLINDDLKMIRLKIHEEDVNFNSIYSILFFIKGIGEKIDHYVITNEKTKNEKKLYSIDSEGYSFLVESIKNDDFYIRKVIDKIISKQETNKAIDSSLDTIDWWNSLGNDLKKRLNFFVKIPNHNFSKLDMRSLKYEEYILDFIEVDGSIEVPSKDKFNEILNLKELNLFKLNIVDLNFLKHFNNIKRLVLDNNKITDIKPLKNIKSLIFLSLSNSKVVNFEVLKNLRNLENLYLNENKIKDINFIEELKNLKTLSLDRNQIKDISILSELKNLENLYLNKNQIKDISSLKYLIHLESLNLSNNQIEDISILSELNNLESLSFMDNQVENIMSLKNLKQLEDLSLYGNPIDLNQKRILSQLLPNWEYKIDISDMFIRPTKG
ncbi:leucine-rich repeat domain-containing protein [Tenacibaculum piscium]|uniref:leucine-rich repeat domain-containing protein n=1 Tax=Tenacibaculum piscium TaxID=1458515 RepID=UPI00187B64DA|nr:leucine-rich repeat domain-containing protein [Tenacibaculum piscium]MBE7690075.1 hypothetical protein [Tenacibaculum piscium]